jgi:hypothetical protein
MIADILLIISIICVLRSLIPACISDYKTRTVQPDIWKYAAYIGIPTSVIAFLLKLIDGKIILPSLILSITLVLIVIIITIILANIRDPLYNPKKCSSCNYTFLHKSDVIKCPMCHYVNAKSILGGADMIAIDIIMITSFYFSELFIPTYIFSFIISSIIIMIGISIKTKNLINYRVPLIIPITIGYILTLLLLWLSINIISLQGQLINFILKFIT